MGIDQGIIQNIKSRLDMVEIVRRYVDLKPMSGRFVAPCPFHQETKPSFSVNPELGFYYCFGCQASGDVFDFYARMNGLEFREALEALAEEAGVSLRDEKPDPLAGRKKQLKKTCLDMHALACDYFRGMLGSPAGKDAREYLARRTLAAEMVDGFSLGCSDEDWQGLQNFLQKKGFSPAQAVEAGLLSRNDAGRTYDRFRGRLIFPIHDLAGRIIAFGGRIIKDGEPKYLNSSDSPIYTKGEHLYGLYQARPAISKSRRVLLTEGYVDVLSLHQYGFREAVGVLGTALTAEQVKRLGSLCREVVLVFDGDNAGRKAALRSAEMILAQGLTCRVVLLPEGQDADDLLRQSGAEAFAKLLGQAGDGFTYCAECVRATGSAREVMDFARRFLRGLRDPAWKAFYLPKLAENLALAESELRQAIASEREERPSGNYPAGGKTQVKNLPGLPIKRPVGQARSVEEQRDEQILQFAICFPRYRQLLIEKELHLGLTNEWSRQLWGIIASHSDRDDAYLYSVLDETERQIWARLAATSKIKPEEADGEFKEVCRFLDGANWNERRASMVAAMNDARKRGDTAEADRLFHIFRELFLGRIDEQS
ncbi:DNA primase [Desulfocurvibacter africanus PCS]|uniref:DNA primase n=1 Tax=Desulfocurvibacter africanus PCS TaxID=1262666 RepID=M5PXR6_DESAF|nr:DNA primase [Desulfocurvibacter africanus]EMG38770.1 DNA primase [Desulfocurvibacter africanus PCS]